ncbi:MAG: hypothetical protein Q4G36_05125 [Paracoccus sp. (in: a-proteobacteria)]|nr:hypothetical protein [Paracoccus sp. (in: a-proteobacteria)]
MSDRPKDSKPAKPARDPRQDRLGAALRANLQRRKAQARARQAETPDPGADQQSGQED